MQLHTLGHKPLREMLDTSSVYGGVLNTSRFAIAFIENNGFGNTYRYKDVYNCLDFAFHKCLALYDANYIYIQCLDVINVQYSNSKVMMSEAI